MKMSKVWIFILGFVFLAASATPVVFAASMKDAKKAIKNPCAAKKLNPCAAKKANPCAAKEMMKTKAANPCAAKVKSANPCAVKKMIKDKMKKNPCAKK